MGTIVVVQQIRTKWSKASRGGDSAGKRNAVPEGARVPMERVTGVNPMVAHHLLGYDEHNEFSQPYEELRLNPPLPPLVVGCVTIRHSEEEVIATFRYDSRCGGAPDRGWARKTFHMTINEWSQFVYNGRFNAGWDGPWYYEKMVVNVGLFERLTPGVFTRQKPTDRFVAMGHLF